MGHALQLKNSFDVAQVVDIDTEFVAECYARLAPFWYAWVRLQRRAFDKLTRSVARMDVALVRMMEQSVAQVASE